MKYVITGGAGFIGSNLADSLSAAGHDVHVVDNFSTGREEFLLETGAQVHRLDLTHEKADLLPVFQDAAAVFHLAANADVRFGWNDTRRDLAQNVLATIRVAEAADAAGVGQVIFSSTGSVYGEAPTIPTPEDSEFPIQTSLYGASKVSAEGFLAAFAARGAFAVTVMRFVSVLGPRYTHGHVIDFVRQLARNPARLTVLGNGKQRKSYMHVDDCVTGLQQLGLRSDPEPFDVFNLGSPEYCTVRDSVGWITECLDLSPEISYGSEDRGWVGDNPFILLDVSKAGLQGWETRISIESAVKNTVEWLMANRWVLDRDDGRNN